MLIRTRKRRAPREVDTLSSTRRGHADGRKAAPRTHMQCRSTSVPLRLAADLEQASEHPPPPPSLGRSSERSPIPLGWLESLPGEGVTGVVDDRPVILGTSSLLERQGVAATGIAAEADARRGRGETVMFAAIDGRLAGFLAVTDPVKASTHEAIRLLHEDGLRIVMLTGDNEATARAVGAILGIDDVIAGVMPDQKRDVVRKLQQEGRRVAMAGDGVNDAPALAEATVGIAMGTGTDVAIESAGVTLVKGDLRGIVRARRLSRATMRNIRQNLFLAFVYNALGVPVAAGVLYPFLGLLVSPIWASAAMTFSSVSVIANALRLRYVEL